MRGIGHRFVYILRSESDPVRHYVGVTSDVDERLDWHNGGPAGHTVNHRPLPEVPASELDAELSGAAERIEEAGAPRPRPPEGRRFRFIARCARPDTR